MTKVSTSLRNAIELFTMTNVTAEGSRKNSQRLKEEGFFITLLSTTNPICRPLTALNIQCTIGTVPIVLITALNGEKLNPDSQSCNYKLWGCYEPRNSLP